MKVSQLPLSISERDFQNTVIDYAHWMKWLVAHFRPAPVRDGKWVTPMQGDAGYFDLTLARDGVVLMVELKRHGKNLEPAQRAWATAAGGYAHLWSPTSWNNGTIWEVLK